MGAWVKRTKGDNVTEVIDHVEVEVHDGEIYQTDVQSTSLANDTWLSLATNGAIGAPAHFTFLGALDGNAMIELLEDATYSTAGTATSTASAMNLNRNRDDYAVKMITNSSVVTGGTVLHREVLPGGAKNFSGAGAGGSRPHLHWVTDPTKKYLVRIINKAGAAKAANLVVDFHIHAAGPTGVPAYWST